MTPDLSLRLHDVAGGVLHRREGGAAASLAERARFRVDAAPDIRIGIIRNAKARLNIGRHQPDVAVRAEFAMPRSYKELDSSLADFARSGVNALVINGGDGTVRDVLTAAARQFTGVFPRVAVVPSGKTNALAADLAPTKGWTEAAAVHALQQGRFETRSPIEVWRAGAEQAELQGFIFGAGAFVRATALAQNTHRFGAFNGLAVGLSVAGAAGQTLFGSADNGWRRGTSMRIAAADAVATDGARYLFFASTLTRLPLDIRPFGPPRAGMKTLTIDAPPRGLARALPAVLAGYALPKNGRYRRDDSESVAINLDGDFVLDGETYAGGELILRRGKPIRFAVA